MIRSRGWSAGTKRWVITMGVVGGAIVLYSIRHILTPFILAAIVAYILNPLVELGVRGLRLPRTLAVVTVYLILIVAVALVPAIFAPGLIQQLTALNVDVQSIVQTILRLIAEYQTVTLFGFPVDLSPFYEEIINSLNRLVPSIAPRSVNLLFGFASGFASTLVGLVLTLVVSFYLLKDVNKISRYVDELVPPDYRGEVGELRREINDIWNAFFLGQIILCLVVGVVTGTALWIVGIRSAFILGLVAGILEIIPGLGPTLSAIPAVILALLQGSTRLSISPPWFALLVAGLYALIQQVENNVLVPRIIGRSVNLHPLVVLLGVVAGASVAGILGIFLAAPVLATARILGRYTYGKLLEREPPVEVAGEEERVREPEVISGEVRGELPGLGGQREYGEAAE
ncbi:MAG: AI-2E family transporter [Anaerolineae bacterium]